MEELTSHRMKLLASQRLEERGIEDPHGNLADAIMRYWEQFSDRHAFNLDHAITSLTAEEPVDYDT